MSCHRSEVKCQSSRGFWKSFAPSDEQVEQLKGRLRNHHVLAAIALQKVATAVLTLEVQTIEPREPLEAYALLPGMPKTSLDSRFSDCKMWFMGPSAPNIASHSYFTSARSPQPMTDPCDSYAINSTAELKSYFKCF